ncbi:MAG: hypothetical protein NZL83_00770 [Candidatus Absconditabacterales bacterium]|nr:hypothetical protein [Candidatus Absconditabacterales bacterium]
MTIIFPSLLCHSYSIQGTYTFGRAQKLCIYALSDLFGVGKNAIEDATFPFDLTPVSQHLYNILTNLPHHLWQKNHNSHITK